MKSVMQSIVLFSTCFLCLSSGLLAQRITNSPYSRLGFGDLVDPNGVSTRGMAGLGSSSISGNFLNFVNPASLSFLNTTAYEFNLNAKRSTISDNTNTSKLWGGNLDYVAIGFPTRNPINQAYERIELKYKWSMGLNVSRVSTIAYNIQSNETLENGGGTFNRQYLGSGGTYKFEYAAAMNYKNFAVGMGVGYLFGKTKFERTIIFDSLSFPFNNQYYDEYSVSGFMYNVGLIYTKVLNEAAIKENSAAPVKRLTFGLRGHSNLGFNTNLDNHAYAIQSLTGSTITDTIYTNTDKAGKGSLPATVGFGINYMFGEKYAYGFDFSYGNWASHFNDAAGVKKSDLKNSLDVSVGGYYRPDYKSYNSYFKRAYYRYGVYYKLDPRTDDGKQLKRYGVTIGTSLPFAYQRGVSTAHIALDFGQFGKGSSIEENYLKINFGFTFNDDSWFIKRKYD